MGVFWTGWLKEPHGKLGRMNSGEKQAELGRFRDDPSKERSISELVAMHKTSSHSGFNAFCGPRIQLGGEQAMENLARCISRDFSHRKDRPILILLYPIPAFHSVLSDLPHPQYTA